jgi:hypothetical protein
MEPEYSDFEREKIERLRRAMYSRRLSEQMHERERRQLHDVRSPVDVTWHETEQGAPKSVVAPAGLGLGRMLMRLVLGASAVFFLGAAGFFGYYFTLGGGSSPVSQANIGIDVIGPLQAAGGEPVSLQVSIVNTNKATLQLAELVVDYPPGTHSPSDASSDLPEQRIALGDIEPGGSRQGTVSAVLAGKEGDRLTIPVSLEYRVEGSNAIFVAKKEYTLTLTSSPLSISVDGNTEAVAGQSVELHVTVAANTATPQKDVVLDADMPFGFTLATADPAPQKGTSLWTLGNFTPGTTRTITIRGTVKGVAGDSRVFHFHAGTRKAATDTTATVPLADATYTVAVSQPFIGLNISANKGVGPSATVSAGQTVTISIAWRNNLPVPISNAVIVAKLSGLAIDGTTVKTTDGFYRSSDNVVFWDKSTTGGAFTQLAPGASGTVGFSFDLPGSDKLSVIRNPQIAISVNAAGSRLSESGVPQNLTSAATQIVKVASDLQLVAQGLYYTNPFGSSGPMPPKAGKETTYAVVFTIMNTTNKIQNGVVSAMLPNYVRWTGVYSPSSENVEFDPNSGKIIWHVGDIEPGVGIDGAKPRQAAVAIGFTPSSSQVGDQPVLVSGITLSGLDTATGATITRTAAPDITTNIANVAQSSGTKYSGEDGFSSANATVVK